MRKKDCDKGYIENWTPFLLLKVDTKILSEAIRNKSKTVLPTLISSHQTTYVKKRFIRESGR